MWDLNFNTHATTVVPETQFLRGEKRGSDMGMFSLTVSCRSCRHYQRWQEIFHSPLSPPVFPPSSALSPARSKSLILRLTAMTRKSPDTVLFYLPISFPLQNAHSRSNLYDTAIIRHYFYLFSLSSTLHQTALQGQQEAGVLFSKQSLWYRDSYNSWISLFFFYLTRIPHAENPSECTAGAAEGGGLTPGKPLRHGYDQRLCRKGVALLQFYTSL